MRKWLKTQTPCALWEMSKASGHPEIFGLFVLGWAIIAGAVVAALLKGLI